ncbi:MAG: hypothetical protein ACLUH5_02225 [Eubacterium sp.]
MKNILLIYEEYGIPENLQMHMLRVAACSKKIVDNWTGMSLNIQSLYRVLLLHDMGNIVKIPEREFRNKDFQSIREKYYALFGKDDHEVSLTIGKELGLNEYELKLMNNKIFINNDNIMNDKSYETKIGAYCDQRVAPNCVMSLRARLNEAKERYKDKPGSSMNNPRTDKLIHCAAIIEQQIMKYCSIRPEDITDDSIYENIQFFKGFII